MKIYVSGKDSVAADKLYELVMPARVQQFSFIDNGKDIEPNPDFPASRKIEFLRIRVDCIKACDVFVLLHPKGEHNDNGLVEAGFALALGKRVYAVGSVHGAFVNHPNFRFCRDLNEVANRLI
jgi:nucleoside 2-deoxyribosyltransferase